MIHSNNVSLRTACLSEASASLSTIRAGTNHSKDDRRRYHELGTPLKV